MLWGEVYYNLHLLLTSNKDENNSVPFGISFPDYGKEDGFVFGNKFRIHADNMKILENVNIRDHFRKFSEYLHISSIRETPSNVNTFVSFSRKQFKTNISYLIRRCAERHNITIDEATKRYNDYHPVVNLPYILLKSGSNHNKFRLHIEKRESKKENFNGFSLYGLSENSSVPLF
jgi:CRISPR-associated endonuclease Csy4